MFISSTVWHLNGFEIACFSWFIAYSSFTEGTPFDILAKKLSFSNLLLNNFVYAILFVVFDHLFKLTTRADSFIAEDATSLECLFTWSWRRKKSSWCVWRYLELFHMIFILNKRRKQYHQIYLSRYKHDVK